MIAFLRKLFRRQHVLVCQWDGQQFVSPDPRRRFCCMDCLHQHALDHVRWKTAS